MALGMGMVGAVVSFPLSPQMFCFTPTFSLAAFRVSSLLHYQNPLHTRCYGQATVEYLAKNSELDSKEETFEEPLSSSEEYRNGYGGLNFKGTVPDGSKKLRLDAWLAGQMQEVSRARIQSSVRQGLVQVNGHPVNKASHLIRAGDIISCTVSALPPLRADPEAIPLDIVYEDNHVLIVNKPAHMVVHPAPGNAHGTLVNGILHHCRLPSLGCSSEPALSETEDESDHDFQIYAPDCETRSAISSTASESAVRPGIVHRLDKGTSVLVVAKFKRHTVHRRYISLTCGVPPATDGCIEIPIARDLNNRIRMAAVCNPKVSRRARLATSSM